ncbi:MAG: phage holin family protein [Betaproteobacteria bacterium]|nr:phage holin family protein [Betaproteobacteria bacterium]
MSGWLTGFFLYWAINVAVLWSADALFHALNFDTTVALLKAGIWLAVINSFLKPIFVVLTLPLTLVTLGLFLIVVNVLMLYCVEALVDGMHLAGFWRTAGISIFISLGTMILSKFIKPADKSR